MADIASGMIRYFVISFGLLAAVLGYLKVCFLLSKSAPRLGAVLSSFVVAIAPAIGGAVLAVIFFGERTAVYVLPFAYVLSLVLGIMGALRKPKDKPDDKTLDPKP